MGNLYKILGVLFLLCPFFVNESAAAEPQHTFFHGVNLPQAGFGGQVLPGVQGQHYKWPAPSDVDMYLGMGANILRIAFLWERMQPKLNEPLNPDELAFLDALVAKASARQVTILVDVHNYGMYYGKVIGSQEVPLSAFLDLWTRLATHYRDNPYVIFGLMNEPHEHRADAWASIAQAGVTAIRKTGAKQLILVPGAGYSGAHIWLQKDGKLSNAEALGDIKDPANNFVYEAHIYFDADVSGTHPTCVSGDVGIERLKDFTAWLRQKGRKAFLGEFGAAKDSVCLEALQKTLQYMSLNNDVWYGWTYWAAAEWFGDYMFNIYPPDANKFPQVDVLKKAMIGF